MTHIEFLDPSVPRIQILSLDNPDNLKRYTFQVALAAQMMLNKTKQQT